MWCVFVLVGSCCVSSCSLCEYNWSRLPSLCLHCYDLLANRLTVLYVCSVASCLAFLQHPRMIWLEAIVFSHDNSELLVYLRLVGSSSVCLSVYLLRTKMSEPFFSSVFSLWFLFQPFLPVWIFMLFKLTAKGVQDRRNPPSDEDLFPPDIDEGNDLENIHPRRPDDVPEIQKYCKRFNHDTSGVAYLDVSLVSDSAHVLVQESRRLWRFCVFLSKPNWSLGHHHSWQCLCIDTQAGRRFGHWRLG